MKRDNWRSNDEDSSEESEESGEEYDDNNKLLHAYQKPTRSDYQPSKLKLNSTKPLNVVSNRIPLHVRKPTLFDTNIDKLKVKGSSNDAYINDYNHNYTPKYNIEIRHNKRHDETKAKLRRQLKESEARAKIESALLNKKRRMDHINEINENRMISDNLEFKNGNIQAYQSFSNLPSSTSVNKIVQKMIFDTGDESWIDIGKNVASEIQLGDTLKSSLKRAVSPYTYSLPIVGNVINSLVSSGVDWGLDISSKFLGLQ